MDDRRKRRGGQARACRLVEAAAAALECLAWGRLRCFDASADEAKRVCAAGSCPVALGALARLSRWDKNSEVRALGGCSAFPQTIHLSLTP
jgi:hypothetical protein